MRGWGLLLAFLLSGIGHERKGAGPLKRVALCPLPGP